MTQATAENNQKRMKLVTIVLLVCVATVYALPLGENSGNENLEISADVDTELTENIEADVNELVRGKRQWGGKSYFKHTFMANLMIDQI